MHPSYLVFLLDNLNTMNLKRSSISALILILVCVLASGQKSAVYQYADNDFNEGISLYSKEKYGAAREAFETVIEQTDGEETQIRAEAMYYLAMCALNLYNNDAEYQAHRFIAENPESPHVDQVEFETGNYFYYKYISF